MRIIKHLSLVIVLSLFVTVAFSQQTAKEAVVSLGRGINIGNAMDPPTGEGTWSAGPVQEYYFDDIKNEGFNHVRIPITWDHYTSTVGPDYEVSADWLDRVEQVVDWALERDLYIVINAHHESWLKNNITTANKARFYKIWEQVSTHFKDHSEKLIFEILNEPNITNIAFVNEINKEVLSIIRTTNPTRNVIYQGDNTCTHNDLKQAEIPDQNDTYLIGGFHEYYPFNFCYYRPDSNPNNTDTWGTTADKSSLKSMYLDIAGWSSTNNIPLYLGEYGCDLRKDSVDRLELFEENMYYLDQYNIASAIWDNDKHKGEAQGEQEEFGIYDRDNRVFDDATSVIIKKKTNVTINDVSKSLQGDFVAYPNPASNLINIEIPSNSSFELIQIFNTEGELILHKPISGLNVLSIDISQLTPGLYLINAIGETIATQSIIKI